MLRFDALAILLLCHVLIRVRGLNQMNAPHTRRLSQQEKVTILRDLLKHPPPEGVHTMPCCYDGITARLVEKSGFPLTFMTGFGVAASHGYPDTGLLTSTEMCDRGRMICDQLIKIPCIGDGDTGYGNPMNVKRTVASYAQAGLAGIMLEDQVSPKRCGHTRGKEVVGRKEALDRIKAAVDARKECGLDIVILARTDARATMGVDEAIERCKLFMEMGADWTFLEAPLSQDEMLRYCKEVPGPKLANMIEGGLTPVLSPKELRRMGYTVAAYPITLLSASIKAMTHALNRIKEGKSLQDNEVDDQLLTFSETLDLVGFNRYQEQLDTFEK